VTVAVLVEPIVIAHAANSADCDPAAMVTLAGTTSDEGELLDKVTMASLAGAAALS
jgi:hypothetical protein